MNLAAVVVLSGAALNNKLQRLRNTERETISEIIQALSDMYTRRYYLELGYSSLFDYCTRGLGYSESGAFRRISVAKCAKAYPAVLRYIQTGKLNLTTASLVAPHLLDECSPLTLPSNSLGTASDTTGKAFELIELVCGKTQNQVKEILALKAGPQSVGRAVLKPGEKVRLVVHASTHGSKTPFATRHQSSAHPGSTVHRENTAQGECRQSTQHSSSQVGLSSSAGLFDSASSSSGRRESSGITDENSINFRKQTQTVVGNGEESNAAVRYELKFSVSKKCQRKLDRARVKLSGKYPRGASLEVTLEELLDSYLEKQTPKEQASRVRKTDPSGELPRSRHIPAAVRRQVFKRDNGACAYVSPEGVKCGCEWDVELDHIVPFSKGGAHTAENLRVLCRAHNNHRNEIARA